MIYIDLETRSRVDLVKEGLYRYVRDPEFKILTGWLFDTVSKEWLNMWFEDKESVNFFRDYIIRGVRDNQVFSAHNASFENAVIMQVWGNLLPSRVKWHCTMAKAVACGLLPSLSEAVKTVSKDIRKFSGGLNLIKRYCMPNASGKFNKFTDSDKQAMIDYCRQDVRATYILDTKLPDPNEVDVGYYFWLTEWMNLRGIPINTQLIANVLEVLSNHKESARNQDLPINPRSVKQLKEYCASYGVDLPNTQAQTVEYFLDREDLPQAVRTMLLARQEQSLSSTAKYKRMLECADSGRIHYAFQYYGTRTGRDAGRKVQPQNFPRGTSFGAAMLPHIGDNDLVELSGCNVPLIAKEGLRSVISTSERPPGFLCGDFSNIETRVLFWLAGCTDALKALKDGIDLYKQMASTIYGVLYKDVTDDQRRLGKEAILGLGFGMGRVKFKNEVARQGIDVSEDMINRAVDQYRNRYRRVCEFWWKCDQAFKIGLLAPDKEAKKAKKAKIYTIQLPLMELKLTVYYKNNFVAVRLPSGRRMIYFKPGIDDQGMYYLGPTEPTTPIRENNGAVVVNACRYFKRNLYGGLIVENIVQSTARDILFAAHARLEKKGYDVVGRFHDELLVEGKEGQSLEEFLGIMETAPQWSIQNGVGLPIKAEGWQGGYYRK